jgi:hypothetical protein
MQVKSIYSKYIIHIISIININLACFLSHLFFGSDTDTDTDTDTIWLFPFGYIKQQIMDQ